MNPDNTGLESPSSSTRAPLPTGFFKDEVAWPVDLARRAEPFWRPMLYIAILATLGYIAGLAGIFPGKIRTAWGVLALLAWILEVLLFVPEFINDLLQNSITRIWAIAGVCFQESIRRRVLWITPLTIVGLVIISQLQVPIDEQDSIRQTIKYCLFASGLLVVVTTVILAATNLPKEIESRVIYTLVTKPTTRLEIIVGKVLGFACVSAAILLIMGVFSYGYVLYRSRVLLNEVTQRLATLSPTDASRPTLEHYANYGLLHAKTYARPIDIQQFAEVPVPDNTPGADDAYRWFDGADEQTMIVPFDLPMEAFAQPDEPAEVTGLEVQVNMRFRPRAAMNAKGEPSMNAQGEPSSTGPWHPTPFPGKVPPKREVSIKAGSMLAQNDARLFPFIQRHNGVINLLVLGPERFLLVPNNRMSANGAYELPEDMKELTTASVIDAHALDPLLQQKPDPKTGLYRVWVQVSGSDARTQYGANRHSIRLHSKRIEILNTQSTQKLSAYVEPVKEFNGIATPFFRGRSFMAGQQLRGTANAASAPVAIFKIRGNKELIQPDAQGRVPMEVRFAIEGTGDESSSGKEVVATASIEVYNVNTKTVSSPLVFPVESNRSIFVSVPADAVTGGDYDVRLRCLAAGNNLMLRQSAVAVVASEQHFGLNLFKSILVLWLMSVLVTMAAVFCSTFVSWPIAVVLTVLILLARWGIDQLGDATGPGIGNQITTEFFKGGDPSVTKAISSSIEGLSSTLKQVSRVLPDITAFSATEDIERGMNMPWRVLGDSILVLVFFGLPMTLLAYVFLKKKEVAP